MKKNQSQAFVNSRFSGHRTWECPWFPGGFCTRLNGSRGGAVSRASWTVLLRKHLLEMDGGNRECLSPPLPTVLHLVSPIQQEGGQGGQPLSLAQGESPIRRLPEPSPPWELGHSGLCKMGSPGSLVHLSTQMFGHLIISLQASQVSDVGLLTSPKQTAENFQTLPSSSWIGTKMSKKMMNSFKRSTNCSSPK